MLVIVISNFVVLEVKECRIILTFFDPFPTAWKLFKFLICHICKLIDSELKRRCPIWWWRVALYLFQCSLKKGLPHLILLLTLITLAINRYIFIEISYFRERSQLFESMLLPKPLLVPQIGRHHHEEHYEQENANSKDHTKCPTQVALPETKHWVWLLRVLWWRRYHQEFLLL